MFNQDALPLSRYLLNFATPNLSNDQHQILTQIINHLFNDLTLGHSCSRLDDLASNFKLPAKTIEKLLLDSGLAAIYKIDFDTQRAVHLLNQLPAKPIILFMSKQETLLCIAKYLAYEQNIAIKLAQLNNSILATQDNQQFDFQLNYLAQLNQKFDLPNVAQMSAIENSARYKFSIITGGPGTGKTTTVTFLLAFLQRVYSSSLKVKICAPTGKAANRVRESIMRSIETFKENAFDFDFSFLTGLLEDGNNFSTIHKLLGYRPNNIYFKHNEQLLLDVDILIVDESSMISLPLYSKLLSALNSSKLKHLIFLGDKNQLSSVEEGYVFASLVDHYQGITKKTSYDLFTFVAPCLLSELTISNRNQGDIAKLATAILTNKPAQIVNIFNYSSIVKCYPLSLPGLLNNLFSLNECSLLSYLKYIQRQDQELDKQTLFKYFQEHAVLCLTNLGYLGVANLNLQIEKRIKQSLMIQNQWYFGRPVMILENDYSLGLYNGDIGICILQNRRALILFEDGREFIPELLPSYQLAYALTIHKSQGSEYMHVTIVLPALNKDEGKQNLLNRELIYTAVTRARASVAIYALQDSILEASNNKTVRISALNELLS